jgi:hypothetical protein
MHQGISHTAPIPGAFSPTALTSCIVQVRVDPCICTLKVHEAMMLCQDGVCCTTLHGLGDDSIGLLFFLVGLHKRA